MPSAKLDSFGGVGAWASRLQTYDFFYASIRTTSSAACSRGAVMLSNQNSTLSSESVLELLPKARAPRAYSKPRPRVARPPEEIWGQYNNYRANGVFISALVHVGILGLLLSGALFGHQIVQKVVSRQTVTLIAPSPDSYALPTSKKLVSGGGGGGDHDPLPAPKG